MDESAGKIILEINEENTKYMTWTDRNFTESETLKVATRTGSHINLEKSTDCIFRYSIYQKARCQGRNSNTNSQRK